MYFLLRQIVLQEGTSSVATGDMQHKACSRGYATAATSSFAKAEMSSVATAETQDRSDKQKIEICFMLSRLTISAMQNPQA